MNFIEYCLYSASNSSIMSRLIPTLCCFAVSFIGMAQKTKESEMVRYADYTDLASEVKSIRQDRLLTLDQFTAYSTETNTVILDTRSDAMYNAKHIKGAIHLNFSDFTEENLAALIPDPSTRILIYCNNNFLENTISFNEDIYFPSKVSRPYIPQSSIDELKIEPRSDRSRSGYAIDEMESGEMAETAKQYTLALNIPTFISLYGYGYQNVYELRDLVSTTDSRIQFEGTAVTTMTTSTLPIVSSNLVNFDDYTALMKEVEPHRAERLVTLDRFNELTAQSNTVILDFRSKAQYDAKHVKGAIHLDFTEFTQTTLDELIPDKSTNVLIYCNNNFLSDLKLQREDYYFQSKKVTPKELNHYIQLSLALNVPAYINLYGYGFKNVYELAETVAVTDTRIQFEGTAVK